jgi:hypothetical protein
MAWFMVATGIENSYPTVALPHGTTERGDEMENTGHYSRWREDLQHYILLVQQRELEDETSVVVEDLDRLRENHRRSPLWNRSVGLKVPGGSESASSWV